jgi:fused signal recognition particle receptor
MSDAESGGTWLSRLRRGLGRSSAKLTDGIAGIFTKRRLDDEQLADLEDLLITADLGTALAASVTQALRKARFGQEVTSEEVRDALAERIAEILEPVAKPLVIDPNARPHVVLVMGVNGSGKTTTIGKLAKHFADDGLRVHLAAGDTFRAAAVEQLKIWGERVGANVTSGTTGADAAGLAIDALRKAREENADVLLIDTAGRLQNRTDLMAELRKIQRVLEKEEPDAPHSIILVLDATIGQNAIQQAAVFNDIVGVTGLVMTKLDGTARGGVLVSIAEKYHFPIHAIGVGETAEDLRPFEAKAFARGLVGLIKD